MRFPHVKIIFFTFTELNADCLTIPDFFLFGTKRNSMWFRIVCITKDASNYKMKTSSLTFELQKYIRIRTALS